MLALTQEAADTIRQLTEGPMAEGVRISATPPAADGQAGLQIELAPGPSADDAVVEAEGAHIYLEAEAMQVLDDKVLHADVEGDEVRFAILEQPEGEGPDDGQPA